MPVNGQLARKVINKRAHDGIYSMPWLQCTKHNHSYINFMISWLAPSRHWRYAHTSYLAFTQWASESRHAVRSCHCQGQTSALDTCISVSGVCQLWNYEWTRPHWRLIDYLMFNTRSLIILNSLWHDHWLLHNVTPDVGLTFILSNAIILSFY